MKLNQIIAAIIVLGLSACGTNRKPMHLSGLNSLSSEHQTSISKGISQFNSILGEEVISEKNSGYEVTFNIQSQQALNSISPGLKESSIRNGFAESDSEKCTISLSEALLAPEREQVLLSVIIHELGHCAGLKHNGPTGKIMSETAAPYGSFSQDVVDEFKANLQEVLGTKHSHID